MFLIWNTYIVHISDQIDPNEHEFDRNFYCEQFRGIWEMRDGHQLPIENRVSWGIWNDNEYSIKYVEFTGETPLRQHHAVIQHK